MKARLGLVIEPQLPLENTLIVVVATILLAAAAGLINALHPGTDQFAWKAYLRELREQMQAGEPPKPEHVRAARERQRWADFISQAEVLFG